MFAMVGLVAVVLIIAGAGSLLLIRNQARDQAQQQLTSEVKSLTQSKLGEESLRTLTVIKATLKLEDADIIRINRVGNIAASTLPSDVDQADIDVAAVQNGQTVSGRNGDLVYAVSPVSLSAQEVRRIDKRDHGIPFEGTFAVLLTRDVGNLGPSWGYFILAGGAALVVAALIAWQMSRRMARSLVEATEATGRIAGGDLESRVPVRKHDYSEFTSLAGSINNMAQSLDDSRARERHLLLAVSHDLRTPLTSIRGFAEAIKDGAIDDTNRAADVIIAESHRLERLVGDLLDLAKLEAHQLSVNLRPTDAAEVVSAAAEGFRPTVARAGFDIARRVPSAAAPGPGLDPYPYAYADHDADALGLRPPAAPSPLPPVAADPDRLAQLVANLIENACNFARTRITIGLADAGPPGGGCVITIDDDGPGIAPGDLQRVFERFYQADRGRNRLVGSGLGLAIVAELAAAMGGTVRAVSPLGPDGGSRFEVALRPWTATTPEWGPPPPVSVVPGS